MELIKVKDVYKTYSKGELNVPVLKGVSLSVFKGEFVALMGASGSGKSTLMHILGCLDRPTSGGYWFDGENLSKASNDRRAAIRNRKIGFVFQSFNLLPRTSAIGNVIMPLSYADERYSYREMHKKGEYLLSLFGLENRIHHEPSQLSGGQQQRVAIARSMINNPHVLFADEPTGNLDSKTGVEVLNTFKELNREKGMTIILVTHDINVANYAQRTIRIIDGVIVAQSESMTNEA